MHVTENQIIEFSNLRFGDKITSEAYFRRFFISIIFISAIFHFDYIRFDDFAVAQFFVFDDEIQKRQNIFQLDHLFLFSVKLIKR